MSTKDVKRLAGRVALVTGGSRGIGAAIAKRLAAEGAAVALTHSSGKLKLAVSTLTACLSQAAVFTP